MEAVMADVTAAVRSECKRQRKRMAILEEMDVLARRLQAVERSHPDRSSGPNPTRAELRDYIAAHGPVSRSEIGRALGGSMNALDDKLRRLKASGEIVVEGERPNRRYRVLDTAVTRSGQPSEPRRPAQVVDCSGPTDLLALIVEHGPISSARLRELTGLDFQQLLEWGRMLTRQRSVTFDGEGPDRSWRPVAERDLRSEVLETIAAQPGVLNERRLALALRARHEHVVAICAQLLDDGVVTLAEGRGYLLNERLTTGESAS